MILSPKAREAAARLIRQVEGTKLAPYRDSKGIWTIGNGTTTIDGKPVTADTPPITLDRSTQLMLAALAVRADAVDAVAPDAAPDCQLTALYSFCYNEGVRAFQTSTLLRLWHAGDVTGAADQFARWVYAGGQLVKGLVNRRRLERAIFLGLTPI